MKTYAYSLVTFGSGQIRIGRQGENLATRIDVDVTPWRTHYPSGTISLFVVPPVGNGYLAAIEEDGNTIRWTIRDTDTAYHGHGKAELILTDASGTVIKSVTAYTICAKSPSADEPADPPEAIRPWVEQILEAIKRGDVSAEAIAAAVEAYIQEHGVQVEETDPTVPAWAKQPSKPTYTASEVGALPSSYTPPVTSVNGKTGAVVLSAQDVRARPDTWTPSASDVGADAAGTASGAVAAHNTSGAAHADLRALIEGMTSRLNALADSDDTTLDQLSEIVAYIKSNRTLIDAVTTGKVSVSDIVDNLTTNASGKVLSAAQGVALKAMIDGIVIPTALPNPQPITINGQRYDGSEAVTVTVSSEGGGTPVEIDDTLTQSGKAADAKVVGDQLTALNEANAKQDAAIEALGGSVHKRTNVMIIAHRGWHETAAQNTIEAFIDAVKNGFKWLEIDIRKTADNMYVMAHDATVTLYNNGTSQSVTIASANYADIKGMTWDAAGAYKISTLAGVFGAMRAYDVRLICDRKSGSNSDIVRLAAHSGMIDKIMLSYTSASAAIDEKALLLKYDHVPIRFIPSDPANIETLRSAVNNPIYADINASGSDGYIKTALAYDIPIVFAGCTASNKAMWQVLAAGCMANLNDNLSYDDFAEMVTIDYTDTATITGNSAVTVALNETKIVSFTSSLDTPAGYIYAYMDNTTYASMTQKTYGSSVNIEIMGKAEGIAKVVLFCGNGAAKTVSVTVAVEEEETVPCTGITLDQTSLTFTGAGSQTLNATVTPSNTTDAVVWSSNDSSIASVIDGVVTAKANGNATITATCGAYSATCVISASGIGEEVDKIDFVFVNSYSISVTGTTGYVTANSGTRMLCASTESNPKLPLASVSGTQSDYGPIKIPSGASQITLDAPDLYGALTLWTTDGTIWTRMVDVGYSTLGGWTYNLDDGYEHTHFLILFKNKVGDIKVNQYDTSKISLTIA